VATILLIFLKSQLTKKSKINKFRPKFGGMRQEGHPACKTLGPVFYRPDALPVAQQTVSVH